MYHDAPTELVFAQLAFRACLCISTMSWCLVARGLNEDRIIDYIWSIGQSYAEIEDKEEVSASDFALCAAISSAYRDRDRIKGP